MKDEYIFFAYHYYGDKNYSYHDIIFWKAIGADAYVLKNIENG